MEIILKSDNKTLEFVSGSQDLNTGDVNLNDDLLHVLTVKPEIELSKDGRESLAVVFEFGSTEDITVPLTFLEKSGKYVCAFPDTVLATEGEWGITILRRRYRNANHEGNPAQTASNTYSFTVSESVKSNGTPVTAAMLQTLYDNADKRATDAENAKVAAAASESNAKSYAESALEYRNAAQAAAENAAAEATEKANKAAADAESAKIAAEASQVAAETAQAEAEVAATNAAAEAVREVNARVSAVEEEVADLATDVAVLNNALIVGGITVIGETENETYNSRITAKGMNVLDGSNAVLKKVVGSTVVVDGEFKNASFAGIESTGRNLIPFPYLFTNNTNAEGTLTITAGNDGALTFNGSTTSYHQVLLGKITLQAGTYYLSWNANKTSTGIAVAIVDKRYAEGKITITEQATVQVMATVQANATADNVVFKPMLNAGTAAIPFTPYIEPSVLNFKETELGKWDSIDFEGQKIVRATKFITFTGAEYWYEKSTSTSGIIRMAVDIVSSAGGVDDKNAISNFYQSCSVNETYSKKVGVSCYKAGLQIFDDKYNNVEAWKAHLAELYASGNPLIVAYGLETPIEETPFTNANEYRAYSGGTESVLGNDNAEYGATNTLSQDYIVVKE